MKAAAYLIRQGPATRQERWEEAGGYSPSTLAVQIAALVCAANFAADRGDSDSNGYSCRSPIGWKPTSKPGLSQMKERCLRRAATLCPAQSFSTRRSVAGG